MIASVLRPPAGIRPFPYNVRINGHGYVTFKESEIKKLPGLDQSAPVSFDYSAKNPQQARPVEFNRPYLGVGNRIATDLTPRQTWYCEGVDTSCGGIAHLALEFTSAATLGTGVAIAQFIHFTAAGTRYLIALGGTTVYYSTNGTTWTASVSGLSAPAVQAAVWAPNTATVQPRLIVVLTGGGGQVWDGASATTTWSAFDATKAYAVAVAATEDDTTNGHLLAGVNSTTNQLSRYADDPSAGGTPVAGTGGLFSTIRLRAPVVWLTTLAGRVYIFLASGEVISATTLLNSAPSSGNQLGTYSTDNGRGATVWGQKIYAPVGNALYEISTGGMTPVGLERLVELGKVFGTPTAFAGDRGFFGYFTTYDGTDSYLWKYGTWVNPEEASAQAWQFTGGVHGWLAKFAGRKATSMFVSDIGSTPPNPFLYIGFDNGNIQRAVLPAYSPFAPADAATRFATSGNIFYPKTDGGFAIDTKVLRAVAVTGGSYSAGVPGDFSANLNATASYDVDSGAAVAISGTITANGQRLPIATGVNGKRIGLKLALASNANTATPFVERTVLELTDRALPVMGPTIYINADQLAINRAGQLAYPDRTSKNLRDDLRTAMATAGDVAVILEDGTSVQLSIQTWNEVPTRDGRYAIELQTVQQTVAA